MSGGLTGRNMELLLLHGLRGEGSCLGTVKIRTSQGLFVMCAVNNGTKAGVLPQDVCRSMMWPVATFCNITW